MTSQLYSVNNRLLALIALLEVRRAPRELISDINKFTSSQVRGPAERRNRAMHDPVFVHIVHDKVGRLEITAQRKPVFEIKDLTVDNLASDRQEILTCTNAFMALRERIYAALPSMIEIPKESPLPESLITVLPRS